MTKDNNTNNMNTRDFTKMYEEENTNHLDGNSDLNVVDDEKKKKLEELYQQKELLQTATLDYENYPTNIVDSNLANHLEELFKQRKLKSEKKQYYFKSLSNSITSDFDEYEYNGKRYIRVAGDKDFDEYEYNGKRYIRVNDNKVFDEYEYNGEKFVRVFSDKDFESDILNNNGKKIKKGDSLWIKVENQKNIFPGINDNSKGKSK